MWYTLKNYVKDPWIIIPLLISYGIEVGMIVYGFKYIHPAQEGVFLRYTILVGPSLRGEWWKLYYIPIVSFVLLIIHTGAGFLLSTLDRILVRLLMCVMVVFQVFVSIAFILLIGINF